MKINLNYIREDEIVITITNTIVYILIEGGRYLSLN